MGIFTTLPHEQIAAYVRGEGDHETHAQIQKLAAENGSFQLLLELIDRFKSRARIRKHPAAMPLPGTFAAMEEMLLRFFAGEAGDDEAQLLINGLVASPQFYQRLLAKLELIAPPDQVPEMSHIEVRTDEELLAQIKAGATIEARTERETVRRSLPATVWEKWRGWGEAILPSPKYAFAIPLMIAGIFLLYNQIFKSVNIEETYVFDQQVPHAYISGLRGAPQSPEENPIYYSFISNFRLGMSDYVGHNYRQAIQTFKKIEPVAQRLMQELRIDRQTDEKLLRELRDYYFYLGLSHLAVARTRIKPPDAAEKTQHLQAATQYLARADSLARLHPAVEENDRETYFLGLAYGFGGKLDSARVRLNRINSNSPFYQKSVPLLKAWAKD